MSSTVQQTVPQLEPSGSTMKALVFRGPNRIGIEKAPIPKAGPGEAVIHVTLTTICGTDLHILRGEYPVKPGLTHKVVSHALCPVLTVRKPSQRS